MNSREGNSIVKMVSGNKVHVSIFYSKKHINKQKNQKNLQSPRKSEEPEEIYRISSLSVYLNGSKSEDSDSEESEDSDEEKDERIKGASLGEFSFKLKINKCFIFRELSQETQLW